MKYALALAVLMLVVAVPAPAQRDTAPADLQARQVGRSQHNILVVTLLFHKEPRNFIVDTGSETSIINTKSFAGVAVVADGGEYKTTSVNGTTQVELVAVKLQIGGTSILSRVYRSDLTRISESAGITIDGILGQDILGQFSSVSINYKTKHVLFTP